MKQKLLKIKMNPVISSNVKAAGFDKESGVLRIEFNGGATYEYQNVPEPIYERIFTSESAGKYVREQVVKAGYTSKKL